MTSVSYPLGEVQYEEGMFLAAKRKQLFHFICYECEVGETYRILFEKAPVNSREDIIESREVNVQIIPDSKI